MRSMPPARLLLGLLVFLVLGAAPGLAQEFTSSPGDLVLAQGEEQEEEPAATEEPEEEEGAAQEDGDGEAVKGRLTFEGEPVEGAEVTAFQDGEPVATGTSDEEGNWRIDLPGPGQYTVGLDKETLGEDVTVRDPERERLDVEVRPGRERTLLFPLGEREGTATRLLGRSSQGLFNGIKFGLIIAITSIGLSLVYGTTRLVNFAHGDMVTFGAVVAFWVHVGGPQMPLLPAAGVAMLAGALLGGVMEKGLWNPLRERKTGIIQLLVISIGLSLVIRYMLLFSYGGRPRPYSDFAVMSPFSVGPITTNARDLGVMALSVLVLVAVGLMLTQTRVGKAMRAVSDNIDLAEASGIDVKRVILAVWILAGVLAALGGVFAGVTENVNYLMGFRLLLLMFAAVILGGLGTAFGAMAGGLVVGIITEMSVLFAPTELKLAWGLAALIVVLLFRPQGIFGQRERIG